MLLGQRVRHIAQQLRPVERDDLDRGAEQRTCLVAVPLDLDEPGRLLGHQALGVGAVGTVNRHAAAPGDEPDDLVARHRGAALRETDEHIVEALDDDTRVLASPAGPLRVERARRHLVVVAVAIGPRHLLGECLGRHMVLAHGGEESVEIAISSRLDLVGECLALPHPLQRHLGPTELAGEFLATHLDHVGTPLAREPLPDLVAGSR